MRTSGYRQNLANRGCVSAESPPEVSMAQDGEDGESRRWWPASHSAGWWQWRLRQTVGVLEIAAESDSGAHQAEKISGDAGETDLLGSAIRLELRTASGVNGSEVLERDFSTVAQVQEIGVGQGKIFYVAPAHVAANQNQAVRRLIGKRMQQHGVGDAEYGGARTDT